MSPTPDFYKYLMSPTPDFYKYLLTSISDFYKYLMTSIFDAITSSINPFILTLQCEVNFNNDKKLTYSCSYVPAIEGEHRVLIIYAGKEIPKSPYKVQVQGAAGDPTRVTASGPGIQRTGNVAGKRTHFEIFTRGFIA